jgi:hypothetical protein
VKPETWEAIVDLQNRGWRWYLAGDADGDWEAEATRGDGNCSHRKQADDDGHGYSSVDTEVRDNYHPLTVDEAVEWIYSRAIAITPGQPYRGAG